MTHDSKPLTDVDLTAIEIVRPMGDGDSLRQAGKHSLYQRPRKRHVFFEKESIPAGGAKRISPAPDGHRPGDRRSPTRASRDFE